MVFPYYHYFKHKVPPFNAYRISTFNSPAVETASLKISTRLTADVAVLTRIIEYIGYILCHYQYPHHSPLLHDLTQRQPPSPISVSNSPPPPHHAHPQATPPAPLISGVSHQFGLIAELDSLAKEFVTAGSDEKKALYDKIEEVGKLIGSASRYCKIYVKAAKRFLSKGGDYAKNEIQRLEHILSKSIIPLKADAFTLKKNILSAFA